MPKVTNAASTVAKTVAFALSYVSPGLYRSNPAAASGQTFEMSRQEDGQWALTRTSKQGKVVAMGVHRTNYEAIRAARTFLDLPVVLPAKTVARLALAEKKAAAKAAEVPAAPVADTPAEVAL